MDPKTPPAQSSETTIDASETVNGPVANGVSSEVSTMKFGPVHAHDVPYDNAIKLPEKNKQRKMI